jgi:hypothetical protein
MEASHLAQSRIREYLMTQDMLRRLGSVGVMTISGTNHSLTRI